MPLVKYEDVIGSLTESSFSTEPLVPLGFSNEIKWLPLNQNTLIVGGANKGRTSFLRSLIFHLVSQYKPNSVKLWLYDAGLNTFGDFSKYQISHIDLGDTEESAESVKAVINHLDQEITMRVNLVSRADNASFSTASNSQNVPLAPKGIAVINFAETFFHRLRSLPIEYAQKFARAVRYANALNLCILMCIQDYSYFIWEHGLNESSFPRKIAITSQDHSSNPFVLLSDDYPLPWLSPIYLSQIELHHRLSNLFSAKED